MAIASKRTKQWFERINRSKNMLWLLGTLSFLETIILPIPLELVLIPLMAVNRQRLWLLALVTTAGCLVASLVGYSIGLVLYESVGTWFIESMGMQSSYQAFQTFFAQYGFAAILAIGILPIPCSGTVETPCLDNQFGGRGYGTCGGPRDAGTRGADGVSR